MPTLHILGPSTLGFIQNIGMMEWMVILIVALLLFGRRLPEVGRSLGKGIVEFKKGLKGVEDEIDQNSNARPAQSAWAQQNQALPASQPAAASIPVGQPGTVARNDA
jgi:sec-independent protein translocase protein TatA